MRPELKNPPLHLCWSYWLGDRSPAARIHRGFTSLRWRQASDRTSSRLALLARTALWPLQAALLAGIQVVQHGAWVRGRCGKGRARQWWEMVSLAVAHSVPPRAYTLFHLYEPAAHARAGQFLHRFEVKHHLLPVLNEACGGDLDLLDDKQRFARACGHSGLPTIPILLHGSEGQLHGVLHESGGGIQGASSPEHALSGCNLIVKPADGKGGRGIERWDAIHGGSHRRASDGRVQTLPELLDHLRARSRRGPLLVQPRLANHPEIAAFAGEVLATTRVVTAQNEEGRPEVVGAVLRMACDHPAVDNYHRGGLACAVDLETGELGPAIGMEPRAEWCSVHPKTRARVLGRRLPSWSRVSALALEAHAALGDLLVVGWDVAITASGPVLVEGNPRPGITTLQRPHAQPLGTTRLGEILAYHVVRYGRRHREAPGPWRRRIAGLLRRSSILYGLAGIAKYHHVDALVISFPKCGRTWLRVQLARVLHRHFGLDSDDLVNVESLARLHPEIPRIRFRHDDHPQRKRPEELDPARVDFHRFKKVIFLVRDPRDVLVSMYMQRTRRAMRLPFHGSLADFVDEPVGSFDTLLRYYEIWGAHPRRGQQILFVRYEDMHRHPVRELRRILDFIGLREVRTDVVEDAVDFASFENMKEMERADRSGDHRLRPADPGDEESFKTRKGRVGGYREYLSEAEVDSLDRRMIGVLTGGYRETL